MFATFKYHPTATRPELVSSSYHPSSADDREYTRTACDLCRAQKACCSCSPSEPQPQESGPKPALTCPTAVAMQRRQRRLRPVPGGVDGLHLHLQLRRQRGQEAAAQRVSTASFKISGQGQHQKPPSPSNSRSNSHSRPRPRTANHDGQDTRRADPNPTRDSVAIISLEPGMGSLLDHDTWPDMGAELDALLNDSTDGADFLSGASFSLCPGKHTSAYDPPGADAGRTTVHHKSMGGHDSAPAPGLVEPPPPPFSNSSPSSQQRQSRASTSIPSTLASTAPPSTSADVLSSTCTCLASMLQTFEDLGAETTTDIDAPSTDSLFACLDHGIEKCRLMLSCSMCDTSASSPTLVVTIAKQLANVIAEVVQRFLECRTPDTVPAVFQFGRYSVGHPALRASLLKSMIELHAKELQRLMVRLGACIPDKQRPMLDATKAKLDKTHQALRDFTTSEVDV